MKIQEFMYRDKRNVEPEMYNYTSNNSSHWNSNEKLKEKFLCCTRKTFNRFTKKDSYTWNITHNMESTALWSLRPEQWGSRWFKRSKKLKCTLVQALSFRTGRKDHSGSRGTALLFLNRGTRRGWGFSVTPRLLFTPEKIRYRFYRRLGGPHGLSGQVRKISHPPRLFFNWYIYFIPS